MNDHHFKLQHVMLMLVLISSWACSTRTEECARLHDLFRSRMTEISAAQAALMSVDQTVVAFGADKGYGITSVTLDSLEDTRFESAEVQPAAAQIQEALLALRTLFDELRRDLKARDEAREKASEVGRNHAASVGRLRNACQNARKTPPECGAVSERLKQFPLDTAAEPDAFHQHLDELKKIPIASAELLPVVPAHILILESLGPVLIDIGRIEKRVTENRNRSGALFNALEHRMTQLAGICGHE